MKAWDYHNVPYTHYINYLLYACVFKNTSPATINNGVFFVTCGSMESADYETVLNNEGVLESFLQDKAIHYVKLI